MEFPAESFDHWANTYDAQTEAAKGFPFQGYHQVLEMIVSGCQPSKGDRILDLGCGTGNLAGMFLLFGCQITGIDFSPAMIAIARNKYPSIHFQVQDVRAPLSGHHIPLYRHIVSAYVFHHFPLEEKIRLIRNLLAHHLLPGGKLIIADLLFLDPTERKATADAYPHQWDEEYFWMWNADLPVIQQAGVEVAMERVSFCAAVMTFSKMAM